MAKAKKTDRQNGVVTAASGACKQAGRSSKPGPKPKPAKPKATAPKPNWQNLARLVAFDAYEHHFSSRRGVRRLIHYGDRLSIFNNLPHPDRNTPNLRDVETTEFREWLKAIGIKELAYATYPLRGEDAGHTYAMILDVNADREDEVKQAMLRIMVKPREADGAPKNFRTRRTTSRPPGELLTIDRV